MEMRVTVVFDPTTEGEPDRAARAIQMLRGMNLSMPVSTRYFMQEWGGAAFEILKDGKMVEIL